MLREQKKTKQYFYTYCICLIHDAERSVYKTAMNWITSYTHTCMHIIQTRKQTLYVTKGERKKKERKNSNKMNVSMCIVYTLPYTLRPASMWCLRRMHMYSWETCIEFYKHSSFFIHIPGILCVVLKTIMKKKKKKLKHCIQSSSFVKTTSNNWTDDEREREENVLLSVLIINVI